MSLFTRSVEVTIRAGRYSEASPPAGMFRASMVGDQMQVPTGFPPGWSGRVVGAWYEPIEGIRDFATALKVVRFLAADNQFVSYFLQSYGERLEPGFPVPLGEYAQVKMRVIILYEAAVRFDASSQEGEMADSPTAQS